MTVVPSSYTNGKPRATAAAVPPKYPKQPKIVGTRHEGVHWKSAVNVLHAAVTNATEHASERVSVDDVGVTIIDSIGLLDARALHVLALVFGMLLRASARTH